MLIAIGILLFVALVVVHEWGHFTAARRNGVEVEEFGIGFPPRIWGKKFGKDPTLYSINLLPLGGFVRLKGENDADKRPGSFGAASLWVKVKIAMAGVGMNFITAAILFTLAAFIGMPKLFPDQFAMNSGTVLQDDVRVMIVTEDSPAAQAGIQEGDVIRSVSGESVTESDQLFDLTEKYAGQTISINYERDGIPQTTEATLNADNENGGYFGVGPGDIEQTRYGLAAPLVGIGTTLQLAELTFSGLGNVVANLFSGEFQEAGETVTGPVGVVAILSSFSELGVVYLIFFIGIISVTLAVMNMLPIPALDGGRVAVTVLFHALKKPLTPRMENAIHGTGFALLMFLVLIITVLDVGRFF